LWSERYRPRSIESMVGNEEQRVRLVDWLKGWKRGSKAALLVGPPGTGKTTAVHLLAERFGLNLVDLNASDTRTRDALGKRVGEVLSSESLLAERTLVFLDEIDGLSGRSDYGAVEFIRDSIKESSNPIAMAANDPDSENVRKLYDSAVVFRFMPPPPREVEMYLRMVAEREGVKVEEGRLRDIVEASAGDMRYALNALQSGVSGYKEREMTAAEAINSFFGSQDRSEALRALRAYPGQPREKLADIFHSVLRSGLGEEEIVRALRAISEADVMLGRMVRGKDWRLLRYFDSMLALGLKDAIGGRRLRYAQDFLPWPLQLRVWNDSRKIREICSLAGRRLRKSRRGAAVQDFPYMMAMCASKAFREEMMRSLNLDETYEKLIAREAGRAAA